CWCLADELLGDADDREARRVLDLEADARRRIDLDRMAVAEVELQLIADLLGAVPDARDLDALAVAVRHALDHVGHERAGEAVQLAMELVLVRPIHDQTA